MTAGPGVRLARQVLSGQSLSDLLAGRSPGERGTANLIKIKRAKYGLSRVMPQQRVLPLIRSRAPVVPGEELALAGGPFPIDTPFDDPFFEISALPGDDVFGGGPPIGAPGGFSIFPPGSSGLVPPGTLAPTPPVPTSPVPEPATWLTMILGFATVGGALRRRRAAAVAGAAGAGA